MASALRQAQPSSGSAMFDAIDRAVRMAAAANAPPAAIRGVVVLAASPADSGMPLNHLVQIAANGKELKCTGFAQERQCPDTAGVQVDRQSASGVRLITADAVSIKVYFVGVGMTDADLEVGRILSEATGSNVVGATPDNLAAVVGVFKGYF
jgi:hypothetical protein